MFSLIRSLNPFVILLLFLFLTLLSCERFMDEEDEYRELDISFKSTNAIINASLPLYLYVYPNPFSKLVVIDFSGDFEGSMQVIISALDGRMKKLESSSSQITIDFSNCQDGVYYCEVLYNNKVYRRQLIKSE